MQGIYEMASVNSMQPQTTSNTSELTLARLLVLTTLAVILFRSFLLRSLWLDETITAWVTSGTLEQVWNRAVTFQGQSPLYYLLVWLLQKIVGNSELALRSFSLLLLLGSGFLVLKIGTTWFGKFSGWVAVLLFISLDQVLVAASARPYALALFTALLATHFFVRWMKTGSFRDGSSYLAALLLTYYAHYLFGVIAMIHLIWYFQTPRSSAKPSTTTVFAIFAVAAALAIPGIIQLRDLQARAGNLAFGEGPTLGRLAGFLVPQTLAWYLGLSLAVTWAFTRKLQFTKVELSSSFKQIICWWLLPPILLYLCATILGAPGFQSRYILWGMPAIVLFGGLLFASIAQPKARSIAVITLALFIMVREFERNWVLEDWRGAAAAINQTLAKSSMPLLAYTGLAELNTEIASPDSEAGQYLRSPFLYYKTTSSPLLAPLPGSVAGIANAAAQEAFLKTQSEFTFAGLHNLKQNSGESATELFIKRFQSLGFSVKEQSSYGLVDVVLFSRN